MDRNERRSLTPRSFFSSFPNIWDEMNRVGQSWLGIEEESGLEVSEDDKNLYVKAHLPGLTDKDIDISLHNNTLWIKGEKKEEETDKDKKFYRRSRSNFSYQAELPAQIEPNSEHAEFKDGVLNVTFRKTTQGNMKKIAIQKK
jgi:HSP20 family protein